MVAETYTEYASFTNIGSASCVTETRDNKTEYLLPILIAPGEDSFSILAAHKPINFLAIHALRLGAA